MQLLRTTLVLTAVITLTTIGCFAQRRQPNSSPTPNVAQLEKELRDLRSRVLDLEMKAQRNSFAELDTSKETYQQVKSNNATFLMTFVKAEPYLNGYKVTLSIGNLTTATFNSFDLKLKWGAKEPEYSDKWIDWWHGLKTKEQHFTDDLVPGRWNRVEVALVPASANELGFLQVSIETNALTLRG
jgi:hypothetical protein